MSEPPPAGFTPPGRPDMSTDIPQQPVFPLTYGTPVPRASSRWPVFGIGAACGGLLVGAAWLVIALAGSVVTQSETFELKGTMTLTATSLGGGYSDSGCYGTGGYNDIGKGASVTVYNGAGNVVATGALGAGSRDSSTISCKFDFAVPNVPSTEKFYQVEVSHRGKITVQGDEAKSVGVHVTLGN